jgi:uncharacterized protein YrrD
MRLTKGADIYSSEGERIGTLDRVVIDPESHEVTHLVISKGLLFKTNKVVAMDMVNQEVEDRITLLNPKHDLEEFQDFEETHYVDVDDPDYPGNAPEASAMEPVGGAYWYPPTSLAWWRLTPDTHMAYPATPALPPYVPKTTQNIPEGTVALEEGAKVMTKDDKYIGNIEQVIVDEQDNRVTHFVINQGTFFTERKLIPVLWISSIDEDEVHLAPSSKVLERLPAYHPSTE